MKRLLMIALWFCFIFVLAACAGNDENIKWAQNLTISDVEKIEAISLPNLENHRYKNYAASEFADIITIVNNAKGRKIDNPEGINGGSIIFYITTSNGERHTFANNGNTYLVIDDISYTADYKYLSKWFTGQLDGKIPDDFVYQSFISNEESDITTNARLFSLDAEVTEISADNIVITKALTDYEAHIKIGDKIEVVSDVEHVLAVFQELSIGDKVCIYFPNITADAGTHKVSCFDIVQYEK